jgi:hypothetical protein
MVIRRYCSKRIVVYPINPSQAEDWLLQANTRYENILKESPETPPFI